jgi:tetratricopeptide (TPR) repeat protein
MDDPPPRTAEVEALLKSAADHFGAGRVEEARKRYSEALRTAPRDLEARDGIARCAVALGNRALEAGQVDRAIAHFQVALELAPFHPEADAGLRRADAVARKRAGDDALGAAIEGLAPVRALRDLQVADRVVGKMAGMQRPSAIIQGTIEARRQGLAKQGAPPREHRIEHEMAAAWRKRWFYRLLPVAVIAVAAALWLLTGAVPVLNWGLLIGGFAALWDYMFVERGSSAAERFKIGE